MALWVSHSVRFSSLLSCATSEGLLCQNPKFVAQEGRQWRQNYVKRIVRCALTERDSEDGRKVIVIGGGVGGLAVGGKLAKEGFDVQILEKNADAGGRLQSLHTELEGRGTFRFDTGPSLLLLSQKYRDAFTNMGEKLEDYVELQKVDPIAYRVWFGEEEGPHYLDLMYDVQKMCTQLEQVEKGAAAAFLRFLANAKEALDKGTESFIEQDFRTFWNYANLPRLLPMLKRVSICSFTAIGSELTSFSLEDRTGARVLHSSVKKLKLSNPESLINQLQVLLCELSCECLDDPTGVLNSHDSTRVGLREKAAKLYFQTVLTRRSFQSYLMSEEDLKNKDKDAGMLPWISRDANGKSSLEVGSTEGFSFHSGSESFGQFMTRLQQGLVDRSYEVRLATLKVLKRHYGLQWAEQEKSSTGPHCHLEKITRDNSFLRPLIIERLSVETHSPCIHRMLQVIYSWTLMDNKAYGSPLTSQEGQAQMSLDTDSVWGSGVSSQELWFSLLKIYKTSKDMKTKEAAVRCLGGCLQHITVDILDVIHSANLSKGSVCSSQNHLFLDESEKVSSQFDWSSNGIVNKDISSSKASVNIWLDIAKVHSAASEAANFRRATAEAIVASGILEDAKWIGHKITEASHGHGSARDSNCSSLPADLEWHGRAVLSAWCMCIKFLEDEDLDLRQKLALSIKEGNGF